MYDTTDGLKAGILKDVPTTATSNNDTFLKIIKPNGEVLKPGEVFYLTIKV